jgi:hypothetical protein
MRVISDSPNCGFAPLPPFQGFGDPRFVDLFEKGVCWVLELREDAKPYPLGRPAGWVQQRGILPRLQFTRGSDDEVFTNVIVKFEGGHTIVYQKDYPNVRYRRVPCPEGIGTSNFYLGLSISETILRLTSTEFNMAGQVTNQFSDWRDPAGVGVIVGYMFQPWGNSIAVSPFLSFDYLNMSVNHTFPNGSFLGTTSNFAATAGLKVGPQLPMGLWLYGIAGVSVLNETLKVNFIPLASSTTTTVAGATVGFGGAFQPTFLQGFGNPVSLFIEYQHTWWQDAQFDTPAASPLFNYNFHREDDTIKFGFLMSLGPPPAALAPSYMPVKAPRLK